MTLATCTALFFAMVVLALIPDPGVSAVTARTASAGMRHGVSTTAGIVAGDLVFITLALLGLAYRARSSCANGGRARLIRYSAGSLLIGSGTYVAARG